MTVTDAVPLACPKCLSVNTMRGAAGNGLCFDCTYEWDPTAEVAAEPAPVAPFAMASVEEVFGPPMEVIDYVPPGEDDTLIGGTARLEGGQLGTVVSFPSVDSVELLLNDGRTEVVNLSDVEKITPRAPEPAVAPEVDTVDDYADRVQMTITLAQLIVMAGVSSVEGSGADVVPVAPPVGFLPDDPALMPVIEQAAAMAVGMLIVNLHLDVDAIVHTLNVGEIEDQGDQTTEVDE